MNSFYKNDSFLLFFKKHFLYNISIIKNYLNKKTFEKSKIQNQTTTFFK